MKVSFKVTGIEKIKQYIESLPRGIKRSAITAAADYLIGNDSHGLRKYPERVEHGKNNPYKWESEKQRRAYFASNGFGYGIPYKRRGNLKQHWLYDTTDQNWDRVKIQNNSGYAPFVQGDRMQKGHIADKWRHYADIIKTNTAGAIQQAKRAVDIFLKSKK